MKEYKIHDDVPKKYKWDLSFLLEGKKPEELLNEIIKMIKFSIENKDNKYNSSNEYLKSLEHDEKLTIKLNKINNYISNLENLNVIDKSAKQLNQKFQFEMYKLMKEFGSEEIRFFKNIDKLKKWAKLIEFKQHKYSIEKQIEEKKYILPQIIEEYIIKTSIGSPNYNEIFGIITDSELDYGYATNSKGKKIKINQANLSKFMKSDDKLIRKTTRIQLQNAYLKHKDSLTSLLYQHKKTESTNLLVSGFSSSVEGLIFADRIDTNFLETLYKIVQKNIKIFVPYKKAYKKFYKNKFNDKITKYDYERPIIKIKQNIKIEDCITNVKSALKNFGKEYNEIVNKAFKENWIDFMTIKNKRSGAYSIGMSYGLKKKLILMNFKENFRDIETLAHELGHSMHSYYSDKTQKTSKNASYPIFLAEIASTFNELMIYDYFLEKSKNKKMKWYILNKIIKGFINVVIKQTEWSNYEFQIYNEIDKGNPIGSYDALAKIYYDNSQKYAIDKTKKYIPKDQFYAIYVPHFYYGFYVYKYAIGQIVANIFFAKYKKEGKKNLKFFIEKFLSAGGCKNPLDILKDAGINLKDPKIYEWSFSYMTKLIKDYIKLGNEIFKSKSNKK